MLLSKKNKLTIGMFYHANCYVLKDNYYINQTYGAFVNACSVLFESVILGEGVTNIENKSSTYKIKEKNVKVYELPYWKQTKDYFRVSRKTKNLAKKIIQEADLIYIRIPLASAWDIWREARRQNKPVIIHVVGNTWESFSRQGSIIDRSVKSIGAMIYELFYQHMINKTPTITQGKQLQKKHKRNKNNVVNLPWFNFNNEQIIYNDDTCKSRVIKLLWVGRFHDRKGLKYLIQGFNKIVEDNNNFHLSLVGSLDEIGIGKNIVSMVNKLGLENNVSFIGYVSDIRSLINIFKSSDIFVFPSLSEGIPHAVLEAMAFGLPVISTSVGGLKELLKDNVNSILVPIKDSDAIYDAVKLLVENSILRRQIIDGGRNTAIKYTIDKFMCGLQKLLESWFPDLTKSEMD